MKLLIACSIFCASFSLFAQTRVCEMSSGSNKTQLKLILNTEGVLIQLAEEDPDQCVLENSHDFELLARCGSDDDSTYFGVSGTSGRVYEGTTTIAQLQRCKRL